MSRITAVPKLVTAIVAIAAWPALLIGAWLESSHTSADETLPRASASAQPPGFVGSATCATCHQTQYSEWRSSQHHVAMQEATEKTVLGDFRNVVLSANGVSTTFLKKDGKFWVRTDGPDGKMADFEIRYTFGIYPLQQYLIALPRGHTCASKETKPVPSRFSGNPSRRA